MLNLSSKTSFGIDIADNTIDVVEIKKDGKKIDLVNFGRVSLAPGIVERGIIKDKSKLKVAVQNLFANTKPKPISPQEIFCALPESQVYTHVFSLNTKTKKYKENDLIDLVEKEAKKNFPLERGDLIFSYKVFPWRGAKQNMLDVLLIGTSRKILGEWKEFFDISNISIESFDVEILASRRTLTFESFSSGSSIVIVDIGSSATTVNIFDEREILRYSHSIAIAGNKFTDEIASALRVTKDEAEKLKIKDGLSDPGNRTYTALLKVLEAIRVEITTAIKYYKRKTGKDVKELIIIGGSSQLRGIADYFSTNLDMTTRIGGISSELGQGSSNKNKEIVNKGFDQETKVSDISSSSSSILESYDKSLYLESIGLALRGLDERWEDRDPVFDISDIKWKFSDLRPKSSLNNKEKVNASAKQSLIEQYDKKVEDESAQDDSNNLRAQKVKLLIILAIGVVALTFAFWYRGNSREKRALEPEQEQQAEVTSEQEISAPLEAEPVLEEVEDATSTQAMEDTENAESITEKVVISETVTGWLNVREGPGTNFTQITRVNAGEEYPLLEESSGWYKIEISDGQEGWIFAQYAKKQ